MRGKRHREGRGEQADGGHASPTYQRRGRVLDRLTAGTDQSERKLMRKSAALLMVVVALAPLLHAGKPTQAVPPSAMVYGTFDATGNTEIHESLWFRLASMTFARTMTVPQDGAWLYGDAVSSRAYPNTICGKKWVGGITPEVAQYTPFFRLGTVPGDVCGPTGYCLAR